MGVDVMIATLVAACLHAAWNAIAHWIPDKTVSISLVNIGGALCGIPMLLLAPAPDRQSWILLGVSAVLHVFYNGLLVTSYRLGDLSQTYPLARGTSPLVVTLLAVLVLGETPTAGQLGGVLLISAGLGCLVFWGRRTDPARPAAVGAAIATGLMIAAYTTVDGVGVRHAHSTLGYIGWLMLLEGIALPAYLFARRGRKLVLEARPVWRIGLTGGALSTAAYGLVLWAQTRGALADVAALRESSIIVGALIGAVYFKEGFGPARVIATCAVTAGIATMYLV
ncbi:EamA family transporter [Nocardia terpenica]|uniref:DMT family transporter n=1 Tax=Nocardia terpenica TaxID=455432 RepID=UPI0018936CED|nr:DMT family transporter [Nocardia terpenica]MBF6062964.1 EamA family transporter [Nocardia terpenica]MBF6104901.1 EamA family transporter [Nocardia terpenica]MBF6112662.1 EamA family transporter [Nocardia terpenica]MBF6118629.1 EamA family transporter [Nocardia terpenica]MBF6155108.1 EamA family transporter [Nocardia terpenica]